MRNMNTISINTSLYNDALNYASKKSMSISTLVELAVRHFISMRQPHFSDTMPKAFDKNAYRKALEYMDTLTAGDSDVIIPADEDGREARVEKYL